MRSRSFRIALLALVVVLPLTAVSACRKGPKTQGANLKERKEKRRALEDAQRRELEEMRRQEAATSAATGESVAAAPDPVEEDTATASSPPAPAAEAAAEEGAPPLDGGRFPDERFSVTLRRPDGTTFKRTLFQPSFVYYERTYLSSGGVRDRESYALMFLFQRQLRRFRMKFRELDRVEVLPAERSGVRVRFRFHFKKGDPVEYPGEELFGAAHPQSPYVQGLGPNGIERFPLLRLGNTADAALVEIDFRPSD